MVKKSSGGKNNKLLSVDYGFATLQTVATASVQTPELTVAEMRIDDALTVVLRQMELSGSRPRTRRSYQLDVANYVKATGAVMLSDITVDSIFVWLDSFSNVQPVTLRSRLKTLKAFLGKCNINGWLPVQFWRAVNIKVDEVEKYGAKEGDVNILLSMLDLTNFVELRDAAAILLMYKAGLRVATLVGLQEKHFDPVERCLNLSPDIMKNHKALKMPISDQLCEVLSVLISVNKRIRQHTKEQNSFIFISRRGTSSQSAYNHNIITQRLCVYSKRYGLQNINPHGLRRGFAQNLLNNGASVPLISKALGHSDLAVTTKYLYLNKEEVADKLRNFV